jgi:hypothetical protein
VLHEELVPEERGPLPLVLRLLKKSMNNLTSDFKIILYLANAEPVEAEL